MSERRRYLTQSHALSPWFTVAEVTLHEPLGPSPSTWHFHDHPGAAAALPITPAGTILVSAEYRVSVDRVILEIPGGRVDAGESPEAAAIREMFEEIGAVADRVVSLGSFLNSPGSSNERTHLFAACDVQVTQPRENTREVGWESVIRDSTGEEPGDLSTVAAVLLSLSVGLLAATPGRP